MKNRVKKCASFFLAALMLVTTVFGNVSTEARAEETATVAEWKYSAKPALEDGKIPATTGTGYISVSGMDYTGYSSNSLSCKAVNEGAYWQIEGVNTSQCENLSFSALVRSTATGPANLVLQYFDGNDWVNVENASVSIPSEKAKSLYEAFSNVILPDICCQENLCLRILVVGNASVNGKEIASSGTFNINNVIIKNSSEALTPSCDKVFAGSGSRSVLLNEEVDLHCNTEGASIYYCDDGSENFKLYEAPLTFTEDTTVIAYASKDGYNDSERTTYTFTIAKSGAVVATPAAGEVLVGTEVILSAENPNAKIYYCLNDQTVGIEYLGTPIVINEDTTIKAFTIADNCFNSDLQTFVYTAVTSQTPPAEKPAGTKLTEIKDGDQFVLYRSAEKVVATSTSSNGKLKGVDGNIEDGKLVITKTNENKELVDSLAVFTAKSVDNHFYFISNISGKETYLTWPISGNGLSFTEEASEYSLWDVVTAENGQFLFKNVNGVYSGKAQYIEYYSGLFTSYGYAEKSKAAFALEAYTAPEINDETTVIDVSGDDVSGDDLQTVSNRLETINENDTFIIYMDGHVISKEASGTNYLKGEAATPDAHDYLPYKDGEAIFEIQVSGNDVLFKELITKKYLTTDADGGCLTLEETISDTSYWNLEAYEGGYHIKNKASVSGDKPQYVEWYGSKSNFSTYKLSNTDAFLAKFYKVAGPAEVDTSVTSVIAQWGGNVNYEAAGVTTAINGDKYSSNDMLDTDATYSAVLSGTSVNAYTSSTKNGTTNYYMGAIGLGSGDNDYAQFTFSTKGYGNISMQFRLRSSGSGAGEYTLMYSTDGVNFEKFNNGSYSFSYTKYGRGGTTTPVSKAGNIADGIAKTSLCADQYISFTFDVPMGAANADRVFVRLVPGTTKAEGDGTPGTGGTLRIDSVCVTANPIIDRNTTGFVKASVENGSVKLNSKVELYSETEGAKIYYTYNGNGEKEYNPEEGLVLSDLPATIITKAKKEGRSDSISLTYCYEQLKCATPKSSPNGGGIVSGTKVVLKPLTEGADCYYRFSEEEEWIKYTDPIVINNLPCDMVIKSSMEGYRDSEEKTVKFTEKLNEKYNIYFGQIHSHTNFSDGAGTCEEAFQHALTVDNLDFLAVTDHSNSLDHADDSDITKNVDTSAEDEWTKGHALAEQYSNSEFTCLYGYEMTWSNGLGHMNTFNTPGFQSRTQADYSTYATALNNYYSALELVPDSISMFNHPGTTFGDFQDFAYYSEARDELINLIEVGNGEGAIGSSGYFPSYEYYTRALDKGWHVAPTNNQDNHKGLWGDANTGRTVVLADANTEDEIYQAMKDRRIYATEDNNLNIYYTLDGYIMGSILDEDNVDETIELVIDIEDENKEAIGKVEVIVNGGLSIAQKEVNTNKEIVRFVLPADYSYYYIKITEADGDIAVTSPVWVGEVEACGLNSVTTSETLAVQGEPIDINVDFYNNEKTDLEIDEIDIYVTDSEGNTTEVGKYIGDVISEVAKIEKNSTGSFSIDFTYNASGKTQIQVITYATLNGVSKVYTGYLSLNYVTPAMVADIIIDGSHYNDYVTGYYGGNMSNFISMAASHNLRAKVVTDEITAETLENCKLLVISDPAVKSGTANTGDYVASTFEEEFINVVKEYVANGGSVAICGLADYSNYKGAKEQNKILEAIGSTIRMNSDEVYDTVNNGGQAYRMYPENFDLTSEFFAGIKEGQVYSQYSGCSIDVSNEAENEYVYPATALVKCFDTTYSVDCKDESGTTLKDASGNNPANDNMGDVTVLAHQYTKAGGDIFVAGGVFISDFEVKAEMDNADSLPYANYTIAQNFLTKEEVVLPTTPISEVRKAAMGDVFAVEGYVTSGTDNASTTFFDTIYIQDETGGIDIFPYSETGLPLGKKVRIVGTVSAYQGDKELRVMSSKVIDDSIKIVKPTIVSTKDAMDYETYGGSLLTTTGKVTKVLIENDVLAEFWIKDESGTEAAIFIDGYIYSATTGKNELAKVVKVGENVTATGVLYMHPEGNSEVSVPVFRVRNCDEIFVVKEISKPASDSKKEDNNTSSEQSDRTTSEAKEQEKDTVTAPTSTPANAVPGRRTANTASTPTEVEVVDVTESEVASTQYADVDTSLETPELKVNGNDSLNAEISGEAMSTIFGEVNTLVDIIKNGGDYGNMISEETAKKLEEAIKAGKSISTDISIEVVTPETYNGADKADIDKALNEYLDGNEGNVLQFLNIEIDILADGEILGNVNELSKEIEIGLTLDEVKTDAEYFVIRNHNGEITVLDAVLGDNNVLTIKSGKFSTYALGYRIIGYNDVPLASKPVKKSVWIWSVTGASAVAAVAVYIVIRKKKEDEVEE